MSKIRVITRRYVEREGEEPSGYGHYWFASSGLKILIIDDYEHAISRAFKELRDVDYTLATTRTIHLV